MTIIIPYIEPRVGARCWQRLIEDFKNTIRTHWVQEMTTVNQKTVAVCLLLFITMIAPSLTFGAVYSKVTGNQMGANETILATSWVGIAYSLIGGMLLCVTGSIGPVLAVLTALFNMF